MMRLSKDSWEERCILALAASCVFSFSAILPVGAQDDPPTANQAPSDVEHQKAVQAQRDALFVYYLLISCAGIGTIISYVVWRSLPPRKSKEGVKQ
jgi:hypothetical protein